MGADDMTVDRRRHRRAPWAKSRTSGCSGAVRRPSLRAPEPLVRIHLPQFPEVPALVQQARFRRALDHVGLMLDLQQAVDGDEQVLHRPLPWAARSSLANSTHRTYSRVPSHTTSARGTSAETGSATPSGGASVSRNAACSSRSAAASASRSRCTRSVSTVAARPPLALATSSSASLPDFAITAVRATSARPSPPPARASARRTRSPMATISAAWSAASVSVARAVVSEVREEFGFHFVGNQVVRPPMTEPLRGNPQHRLEEIRGRVGAEEFVEAHPVPQLRVRASARGRPASPPRPPRERRDARHGGRGPLEHRFGLVLPEEPQERLAGLVPVDEERQA